MSEQNFSVVALILADALGAIRWIGRSDASIGTHDCIIRGVAGLAVKAIGKDSNEPIMLAADDLPSAVLAGDLAALPLKRVAVTVAGGLSKHTNLAVLFEAAVLDIARDIAQSMPFRAAVSSHNPPVHTRAMASGPATGGVRAVNVLVNRLRGAGL